jgi:hypothetical protein
MMSVCGGGASALFAQRAKKSRAVISGQRA